MTYEGVEIRAPPFLTSAIDGGEWSASRSCRFNPGEMVPVTHCIGGWVGPRTGMDSLEKRKLDPSGNRTPITYPVARRYTDSVIPAPSSRRGT
jgi:hypothetical protein